MLQLFGKLIPLPANKATKVHKVAWREEEASITWQRFSFQPKWGNFPFVVAVHSDWNLLHLVPLCFLQPFPIPNMCSSAILRPCKHHCAANCYEQSFCSQFWKSWKIFIDVNKCFNTDLKRGRFFANWKAHVLFCELFPQLLMRGFPFSEKNWTFKNFTS